MIWTAFVLGILGSIHCVGMCGPIALAVPTIPGKKRLSVSTYLLGKSFTYATLGAVFGLMGLGLSMNGFQSQLSIFTGLFILAFLILPKFQKFINRLIPLGFQSSIQRGIAKRIKIGSFTGLFSMGVLNGFLPCGLIYIAVAAAMETGFIETAALYMFIFGMGTSVVLWIATLSRDWFIQWNPALFKKTVPYFTFALGLLFIVRGILFQLPSDTDGLAFTILKTITLCHATP